jgi:hypothetical protein
MTEQTKQYLKQCIEENDLVVFGMWDAAQGYGVFHKWGRTEDIAPVLKAFKSGMATCGLKDVFKVYTYPEFTLEQFDDFLNRANAWTEFCKTHELL